MISDASNSSHFFIHDHTHLVLAAAQLLFKHIRHGFLDFLDLAIAHFISFSHDQASRFRKYWLFQIRFQFSDLIIKVILGHELIEICLVYGLIRIRWREHLIAVGRCFRVHLSLAFRCFLRLSIIAVDKACGLRTHTRCRHLSASGVRTLLPSRLGGVSCWWLIGYILAMHRIFFWDYLVIHMFWFNRVHLSGWCHVCKAYIGFFGEIRGGCLVVRWGFFLVNWGFFMIWGDFFGVIRGGFLVVRRSFFLVDWGFFVVRRGCFVVRWGFFVVEWGFFVVRRGCSGSSFFGMKLWNFSVEIYGWFFSVDLRGSSLLLVRFLLRWLSRSFMRPLARPPVRPLARIPMTHCFGLNLLRGQFDWYLFGWFLSRIRWQIFVRYFWRQLQCLSFAYFGFDFWFEWHRFLFIWLLFFFRFDLGRSYFGFDRSFFYYWLRYLFLDLFLLLRLRRWRLLFEISLTRLFFF